MAQVKGQRSKHGGNRAGHQENVGRGFTPGIIRPHSNEQAAALAAEPP